MGQENKYIFDIDTLEQAENEERINNRRNRHKRGRILSWIFLVVFLCLVVTGVTFGVRSIVKKVSVKAPVVSESVVVSASTDVKDELSEAIDNLLGGESEVVLTPNEDIVKEPTEEELYDEAIRAYVASISIEDKVAGIFIVTPEELTGVSVATRAGDGTKTALEKYAVGGLVYSSQNMTSADQFNTMIENTKAYARYPLFLAADEELGKTTFSDALKMPSTMTAGEIGATNDPSISYLEEEKIAKRMSEVGLNLNLGVVADPLIDTENSYMKGRCYGSTVEEITPLVSKAIAALNEYGVKSAVKFFPGQGASTQDTASGLSVSNRNGSDMEALELECFKAAIEAGGDMLVVGHISAPELTGDNTQCSQSKYVMTDVIRKMLELDDVVVVTDSLSKSAISSYLDSSDACITAIKAGADMVMCPENFTEAYESVLEAINTGVIAKERVEDSLVRIYKVKFKGMSAEEVMSLVPESSSGENASETAETPAE